MRPVNKAGNPTNRALDTLNYLADHKVLRRADQYIASLTALAGFDKASLFELTEYCLKKSLRDGLSFGDLNSLCWALLVAFCQFKNSPQSIYTFCETCVCALRTSWIFVPLRKIAGILVVLSQCLSLRLLRGWITSGTGRSF